MIWKLFLHNFPFVRGGGFLSQWASYAEYCCFLVNLNNFYNKQSNRWWFVMFPSSCDITVIWWDCIVLYVYTYHINHWYHNTVHLYICIIHKRSMVCGTSAAGCGNTIYPIKYAHGFVVLWFAWIKYSKTDDIDHNGWYTTGKNAKIYSAYICCGDIIFPSWFMWCIYPCILQVCFTGTVTIVRRQ